MRRLSLMITLMFGASLLARIAPAQEARQNPNGLAFGLRTGYGLPMGTLGQMPTTLGVVQPSNNLSDAVSYRIPLWLDLGYRVSPAIFVGGFFQYGMGSMNTSKYTQCTGSVSCSAHDVQFGIQGHYHVLPASSFDPWLGLGFGYEILSASISGSYLGFNIDDSLSVSGFQFLNLQGGGDIRVLPNFGFGPFLSLSLGKYNSYSMTYNNQGSSTSVSGDLANAGLHEWLTIGVRGQYDLCAFASSPS